ncbi:copper resistance CopC family protein [Aliikangiella sp. G2MR2-5]|uniref:copper resistance CopC family protein n=1 Tax=Aliikangiella sp. G2MR2-5 TaxID=2788943 RepID=UPI0018A9E7FB|nr:copper resistance CopC family protein [Aliikangiella sp. G2MR2-5]
MKITNLTISLVVGFLLLFSMAVNAHSKLIASEPADGSVADASPEKLKLTFSSKVRLIKVEMKDMEGENVEMAFMLSPIASENFEIPLPRLLAKKYRVSWVAMGKDSHKMNGEFSFEIKTSSDTAQ